MFRQFAPFALLFLLASSLAGCSKESITIDEIYDGDTFSISTGKVIRMVQIDTPELSTNECYAEDAKVVLSEIIEGFISKAEGTITDLKTLSKPPQIELESDSALDSVDKYGRKLSYLFLGGKNINIELVRRGAALPFFYGGAKGKYAAELEKAADFARQKELGIWEKCRGFTYNPYQAASTGGGLGYSQVVQDDLNGLSAIPGNRNCSPHYRECVPQYPPDYDCGDLISLGLIHVIDADPHRLDRDGDGLACESNAR